MKRYTRLADRQEMISLRQAGHSYSQIVEQTGWSIEMVGKICRAYQAGGEGALKGQPMGRPRRGALSSFEPVVRYGCLRIKCQHRGWGPEVVLAELAKRPWASRVKLPSASRIGAYFSQFGDRLVRARSHKQLPQAGPLEPALRYVHACWQLDSIERFPLPNQHLVNILNLVDYATGLKIGSFVFTARRNGHGCRVSWPQMQDALRQAFSRWGLPDRIRTDRDRVIVAQGNYPFPKFFSLWLVGLGIEHELIRRVIENGSVERAHQTWQGRLSGYGPFDTLAEWQAILDYELWRMNAVLPSRGRNCRRRPPLLVYPEARSPRRFFRPQDELALFDLRRVQAYLADGKWLRKTSQTGNFAFNNQHFYLGRPFKNRVVQLTYQPNTGFLVTCPPDTTIITTLQVAGLTMPDITALSPSDEFVKVL